MHQSRREQVLGTAIYEQIQASYDIPATAALAMLFFRLVLVLLFAVGSPHGIGTLRHGGGMSPRQIDHTRPVTPLVSALGIGTLLFVLLPLPFIVLYSFSKSNYALLSSSGFTLEWFRRFFENERFMSALLNSILVSVITTLAAVLIAMPTALIAVSRLRLRARIRFHAAALIGGYA